MWVTLVQKRFLGYGAAVLLAIFWCPSTLLRAVSPSTMLRILSLSKGLSNGRSTTSEQMVSDLKGDPHTPFLILKKRNLKFDLFGRYVKTTTYINKKIECNVF